MGVGHRDYWFMSASAQFFINHGLTFIFVAVFLEQMGLPLPAFPWLLAAGALAFDGKMSFSVVLFLTVFACLIADFFWFYLGLFQGGRVLGLLCRISLEPDTCVRRTMNVFTRYGLRGILIAKFVPGLSTVVPPLAGMSNVKPDQFLLFDGLGSLFYCGSFMLVGYFFSHQITQIGAAVAHFGGSAFTVVAAVAILYIAYKYWQRQRLLHELRARRITAAELFQKVEAGENPVILDLRSREELVQNPTMIQGAIHIDFSELEKHRDRLPRDRDIVLYCSCPNEITSAKVALALRRQGFTRVHPLLGGIDTWRQSSYPLESWTTTVITSIDPAPDKTTTATDNPPKNAIP
jgi:membrane protein DedA with SNARE-associated domain/rhodanese-related sulfurtransferase